MRAVDHAHVLLQRAALHAVSRGAVLRKELGNDPLEAATPFAARGSGTPRVGDVPLAGSPEQIALHARVKLLPGRFEHGAGVEFILALERLGHAAIDVPAPPAHLAPPSDQLEATLLKRLRRLGDEPRGIEPVDLTQPLALGAHALWAVEAEHLRTGRLEAFLAVRACIMS